MSFSQYIRANLFHSTTALYELAWQKHLSGRQGDYLNVAINVVEVKLLNRCADLLVTRSEKRASELDHSIRKCQRYLSHLKSIRDNPIDSFEALERIISRPTPIFSSHYQLKNCLMTADATLQRDVQPAKNAE